MESVLMQYTACAREDSRQESLYEKKVFLLLILIAINIINIIYI